MIRQRQNSASTTPEKASAASGGHILQTSQPYDETLMQRLLSIDDADAAAGATTTTKAAHDVSSLLYYSNASTTGSSSSSKDSKTHAASSSTWTQRLGEHLKLPLFPSSRASQEMSSSPPPPPGVSLSPRQQQQYPLSLHPRTNTSHHATTTPPPLSMSTQIAGATASDLEVFDDLVSEPVLVLGLDISHFGRTTQFCICASGVFVFSLLYGYLQELISVQLCHRQLGLFLATVQFVGYTILAYFLRRFVYEKHEKKQQQQQQLAASVWLQQQQATRGMTAIPNGASSDAMSNKSSSSSAIPVPFLLYLGLSLLRALDLGMTNLAMQYINYPAKTLLKSSRVVFTMLFGVILSKKSYAWKDYVIVGTMVLGLALFLHADAHSSAVFAPLGVIMLTISLICDGAITNVSETIMQRFGVGQDEFIFKMYSIALVAISVAAAVKGDLREGLLWLMQPGTYAELSLPVSERTWSVPAKLGVLVLFSSMGFFGSSCSAAITKQFGALTMSITSVTRKATTLFLSFFLFNNVCTFEHLAGVFIFISALTAKSLRRRNDKKSRNNKWNVKSSRHSSPYASGNSLNSHNSGNMTALNRLMSGGNPETLKQLEMREMTTALLRAKSEDGMRSNAAASASNYGNSPYIV